MKKDKIDSIANIGTITIVALPIILGIIVESILVKIVAILYLILVCSSLYFSFSEKDKKNTKIKKGGKRKNDKSR